MNECSTTMQKYFAALEEELERIFSVANQARKVGIDPVSFTEIHPAKDLASRVEVLLGPEGVADRIRELNEKVDREQVAFKIAEEIVNGKYGVMEKSETAELATRVALSILTGGITAAPLEGISSVKIRDNFDKTQYLAIYFAGPIRSAGGTEAALAVLVGDWVRKLLKLDKYKPIQKEVERYVEEVTAYKKEVNLQYPSTPEEIRNAAKNIPIEITGEPTEQVEVSGYRDLKRIDTNQLRGGACLVLNDGIIGKAHKLVKIVKKLEVNGWNFLETLQIKKKSKGDKKDEKIPPKDKFIAKVITGRPVFAYPSWVGGFRIRYGRSRDTGFAAVGINPATMILLDHFLVPGTQFITERPGKGSIVLPVDSIEGPIVRLKDGEVCQINTVLKANALKDKIEEFLFLGDCLIAFGEFLENNHILVPSGYCEEWWVEELSSTIKQKYGDLHAASKDLEISTERLQDLIQDCFKYTPSEDETITIATKLQIPVHPKYNCFWTSVKEREIHVLRNWLKTGEFDQKTGSYKVAYNKEKKKLLEKLGIPHKVLKSTIIFNENIKIIHALFGITKKDFEYNSPRKENLWKGKIASFKIQDRSPYYLGARMGRPEKAKGRKFFNVLFPTGIEGGGRRSVIKAADSKKVNVEIVHRECPQCGSKTFLNKCAKCGVRTILIHKCSQLNCQTRTEEKYCPRCGNLTKYYDRRDIPIKKLLQNRLKLLKEPLPKEIKGVKGLMSEKKIPEIIEKGILRAKHDIFVYRDGTIRFDATDAPLTHFKPSEIGVSVTRVNELGYKNDIQGNPLIDPDQIIELKIQDIVMPLEGADFFIRVASFIDDLLVKVYHLKPFYNIRKKEDLIGHLVIGLAPHISAGVIGRILGFTKARLCYAHPYWHSAKRRNCDGDEDTIILGLDGILNFSRSYLPKKKGGMMDAPLVLTSQLDPNEIDDEVYNMEISAKFSRQFYECTLNYEDPKEVQKIVEIVEDRIGSAGQFEGLDYTHPTTDINIGPEISRYKELKTVREKVKAQLDLAVKTIAADAQDEALRLLNTHFIPDIMGNLRSFATQKFRCSKCNAKYRRLPLKNQCLQCGGKLIQTVSEGTIIKYLGLSVEIANQYKLGNYVKQRLLLAKNHIESIFNSDKGRQIKLDEY
ncbi:MAG: DNA polymerase II large subunit [Candidatus Helarchaeota archaeon]